MNPLKPFASHSRLLYGILVVALVFVTAANAREGNSGSANSVPNTTTFSPNVNPFFKITQVTAKPRIDGVLDDPIWKTAVRIGNFAEIQPGENIEPKVATEAMFAYDSDNFYAAFVCYDNDPEAIRATIADRDAIFRDDFVGIMVDTFKDQQNGYEFFVNPHGVQGDLRRTSNNEDASYDAVWYSGGKITDNGWTAEISIPFRSIRFPDAENQEWGMHVLRIRPRDSREQISWVPISRDDVCLFCQAGTVDGLEGINQGKNIEILPYVISSQYGSIGDTEDANSSFANESIKGDAGLGLKYGITSNYTLDFSYNPDFSQIESDAAQINVNRTFAVSYPERRPFFLEGSDIFRTRINTVYTRMVNDPILAGKITGKSGKTTVGYMLARDENTPYIVPFEECSQSAADGRSYSNILRVKRDVLDDSFYGMVATDRRNETNGGANTTFGVDGTVRFLENYQIEAQLQGSYTKEPDDSVLSEEFEDIRFGDNKQYDSFFNGESFTGHALDMSVGRDARHWNFWTWFEDYSPTFRSETGRVFGNNFREVGLWTGYNIYTDKGKFTERLQPQLNWGRKFNSDGAFKDTWMSPSCWIRFRKQTSMWMGILWSNERFNRVLVNGIRRFSGNINTDFSAYLSGGMDWSVGRSVVRDDHPRLGYETRYGLWATVKPTSQLKINVNFRRSRLEEMNSLKDPVTGEWVRNDDTDKCIQPGDLIGEDFIVYTKMSYQFTKNMYLRLVTQYVDSADLLEFNPLLSYKLNPFTVFFIGSSHNFFELDYGIPGKEPRYHQTDRTYFVKFQYLFRV